MCLGFPTFISNLIKDAQLPEHEEKEQCDKMALAALNNTHIHTCLCCFGVGFM